MGRIYMCKKCGNHRYVNILSHVISLIFFQETDDICKECGFKMTKLPNDKLQEYGCFSDNIDILTETYENEQKRFVDEYVSNFPEFDREAYQNRLKNNEEYKQRHLQREEQQQAELQAQQQAAIHQAIENQKYTPKCPICGSPDISKITVTTRVAKTAVFGTVGALDDAGKTWKCNKCCSKF